MELTDLRGVGPALAQRLYAAGLRTVDDIARADVDALVALPGIGPTNAARIKADALALVADSVVLTTPAMSRKRDRRQARVAKSVKSLRKALPDLAKTKKDEKRLKKSADRLSGWVDDLGKRKVRKRFIAEVSKIGDQAKRRTGSKRDAKLLREHASAIESAVRKGS